MTRLTPTAPAFLTLLEVPVEDPQWQALEAAQRRQRTLDALKGVLVRESQVQPVLLLVEDLHWIDTETQAFLDTLVDSLPTARLLLLVNYRPGIPTQLGPQDRLHAPAAGPTATGQRRGAPAFPAGG